MSSLSSSSFALGILGVAVTDTDTGCLSRVGSVGALIVLDITGPPKGSCKVDEITTLALDRKSLSAGGYWWSRNTSD